jgi:hypothetical protein
MRYTFLKIRKRAYTNSTTIEKLYIENTYLINE